MQRSQNRRGVVQGEGGLYLLAMDATVPANVWRAALALFPYVDRMGVRMTLNGWIFELLNDAGHTLAAFVVGSIVFAIVFILFCLGSDRDHPPW